MANENSDNERKQFYSIGEVARIVGANETTLRFWEKEFKEISPRRSSRGVRFYSNDDLKTIKLIHHLIKEKGMTLDGTRKRLKDNRSKESNTLNVVNRLQELRAELIAIRNGIELIETKKSAKQQSKPAPILQEEETLPKEEIPATGSDEPENENENPKDNPILSLF